ncbi:hypothetical protein EC973_002386 [Apophysomyces ossiformis]|uniref:Uncharacterized protein n=1 Tax=Apophysomyces ossiformis TaxID=679940 RepID=A0A8H7ELR1_9FUNG|nr:hypothetical protein EC973_002386 [Apophysomyces ossiformis]
MYEKQPDVKIIPTRRTKPLCRKNKPAPIIIPPPIFHDPFSNDLEDDEFSAWSYEEPAKPDLMWDSGSQTMESTDISPDSPSYSPKRFLFLT